MNYFRINNDQPITLPQCTKDSVVVELLTKYTPGVAWNVTFHDALEVRIGEGSEVSLDGNEYAVNIEENGVFIKGVDYAGTIRGFLTFLETIFCYGKLDYRAECGILKEKPDIAFRAVHVCLFPEYSFEAIRRVIRTSAIAKYTHIFLESWGSVRLDTLKELSWENTLTKEQIRELVKEANLLGMKVVPFFQHLGHASLARLGYSGKHTILDQNPELEYLYYPKSYGWVWNFKDQGVKKMLEKVREELMELFGEAEYFHLGCDEAGIEFDPAELCAYLNEVSASLKAKGRRAIIWGDMLLSHDFFQDDQYECNSSREYASALLDGLDKDILIADWQYNATADAWKTTEFFKRKGFDVICCPWDGDDNMNSSISTAKSGGYGVMKTTWAKLFEARGIPSIVYYGLASYHDHTVDRYKGHVYYILERSHAIFRRAAENNDVYENAGWTKNQV